MIIKWFKKILMKHATVTRLEELNNKLRPASIHRRCLIQIMVKKLLLDCQPSEPKKHSFGMLFLQIIDDR